MKQGYYRKEGSHGSSGQQGVTYKTTASKIVRNMTASLMSDGSAKFARVVATVLMARLLGKAGLGKYSTALSFVMLFQVLADFGLEELLTRAMSQEKARAHSYLMAGLALKAVFSVLTVATLLVVAVLLQYDRDTFLLILVVSLSVPFSAASSVFRSVFSAFGVMKYSAYGSLLVMAADLVLSLVLLFNGAGPLAMGVLFLFTRVLGMVLSYWFTRRTVRWPNLVVDWRLCRHLARTALPFVVVAMLVSVPGRLDVVLLSKITTETEVAVYTVAYGLFQACLLVSLAYNQAVYPVLSAASKTSRALFVSVAEDSIQWMTCLALFFALALNFSAELVIKGVYGPEYADSVLVLRILAWALVAWFLNMPLTRSIYASGNQRVSPRVAAVSLGVNLALNLWLIPTYGARGAAIAVMGRVCTAVVQNYIFVRRRIWPVDLLRSMGRPLVAAGIVVVVGFFLPLSEAPWLIAMSLCAYPAALMLVGVFRPSDLKRLGRVFLRVEGQEGGSV